MNEIHWCSGYDITHLDCLKTHEFIIINNEGKQIYLECKNCKITAYRDSLCSNNSNIECYQCTEMYYTCDEIILRAVL